MGWVIDLDGVVWLAHRPIPGAVAALGRLVERGEDVVFCTNNSSRPVADQEATLESIGVPARGRVVTSAQAAARLLVPGDEVLVCGGPGVVEAVEVVGATVVPGPSADAVVVGLDLAFDYQRLAAATAAVRAGARFIATNDDATYPTPDGLVPGGGALVAAVATAAETAPEVAGKPHEPMAALVRERLGPEGIVVGDRPSTDGRFARTLGYRFGLVLSGVTGSADLPVEPAPDVVSPDLATLVDRDLA